MKLPAKAALLLAAWSASAALGAASYRTWGTQPFPTTLEPRSVPDPQSAPIDLALAAGTRAPAVIDDDHEAFEPSATHEQLASWRALAEAPVSLLAEIERDNHAWVRTIGALSDPHLASRERLACGETYARGLAEVCAYRLTYVVQRANGLGEGTIVYSRADLVSSVNGSQHVNEPMCRRYVNCVAASRLGGTLPLPPGSESAVALRQSLFSRWTHPSMNDPAILRRNAGLMAKDAERRIDEGRDVTAGQQLKLEELRSFASYMAARADQLDSARGTR